MLMDGMDQIPIKKISTVALGSVTADQLQVISRSIPKMETVLVIILPLDARMTTYLKITILIASFQVIFK